MKKIAHVSDFNSLLAFLSVEFQRPFKVSYLSNSRRYIGLVSDDYFEPSFSILVHGSDLDPWRTPEYQFLEVVEGIYPADSIRLAVLSHRFSAYMEEIAEDAALENYMQEGGLFA